MPARALSRQLTLAGDDLPAPGNGEAEPPRHFDMWSHGGGINVIHFGRPHVIHPRGAFLLFSLPPYWPLLRAFPGVTVIRREGCPGQPGCEWITIPPPGGSRRGRR